MIKKKIITICASVAHYKYLFDIQKELRALGYTVIIPKTAYLMKRNNNFDVNFYKTWYKDKSDYKKKTQLIKAHFKEVLKSDAILVVNFEKNGLPGYIGGNVLMEMTLAFHYKKPIFIYHHISEDLSIKEEVYGMEPIFIDEDLLKIKKKIH
jgi:UDP-N-acetylglucosamine:LPS N-acetylglucosamine transferase